MENERERIAELVVNLQNGDNNAFNELYKLTSPRAYFVALEITKNEQDAEDILQESYVKMLERIGSLDKPESFVSWFHQIVANRSKDSLRKKKPTLFEGDENEAFEVIPDEDTSFSPEENLNQDELRRAVMEVIEELTEEKRACVLMMYFEEMSVNEIADTLEVPVSTVKNRLFTARKDLKNKFAKRGITSLYSAAPIGVVIWALRKTSEAISNTFANSPSSAKVLGGITVAGSGTAAAGAAAAGGGTAAATAATAAGTGAAGTAAATGVGVTAKVAALTVTQKVVAGLAITGVVTGSAVGVSTVIKNNAEETATTSYVEEVTTAPSFETSAVLPAIAETSEASTAASTEEKTTEAETEPTATTAKPTTTAKVTTTEEPTVTRTKRTTTRRDYSLDYTKAPTSAPTTVATTTRPTTTEEEETEEDTEIIETTTKATTQAPASVVIDFFDLNGDVSDTLTVSVPAGTQISKDYIIGIIESNGYTPMGGIYGTFDEVAEPGGTYKFEADL